MKIQGNIENVKNIDINFINLNKQAQLGTSQSKTLVPNNSVVP